MLDQRLEGKQQPFAVRTILAWMLLGPRTGNKGSLIVNTTLGEETEIWTSVGHTYDMGFQDIGSTWKETCIDEYRWNFGERCKYLLKVHNLVINFLVHTFNMYSCCFALLHFSVDFG